VWVGSTDSWDEANEQVGAFVVEKA
jgi:hypothetical protein